MTNALETLAANLWAQFPGHDPTALCHLVLSECGQDFDAALGGVIRQLEQTAQQRAQIRAFEMAAKAERERVSAAVAEEYETRVGLSPGGAEFLDRKKTSAAAFQKQAKVFAEIPDLSTDPAELTAPRFAVAGRAAALGRKEMSLVELDAKLAPWHERNVFLGKSAANLSARLQSLLDEARAMEEAVKRLVLSTATRKPS